MLSMAVLYQSLIHVKVLLSTESDCHELRFLEADETSFASLRLEAWRILQ